MSSGKRVLGRGLADLIPVGGGAANVLGVGIDGELALPVAGQEISIASLHANPNQPRTRFDEGPLEELANSIKANGILQPILVRPRIAGGYEIVAGERRYRAALRAGLVKVPVVIRELTDEDTLALALIENLIREDIGAMETARAFRRLMDDFGWTQEEMGQRVGKSRPAIANSLRLLELPPTIQVSLEKGDISEGHARALLGDRKSRQDGSFLKRQQDVYQQAVNKGLSVRDVERMMAPPPAPASGAASAASKVTPADWKALEDRLRTALGTRVRLTGTEDKGKIEVEFFSSEELEGLLVRLDPPPAPLPSAETPQKTGGSRISGLLTNRRSL
ncbi:ParB/RepB/Spo0J family partition protein [Armatimonas rosea]|uniref:ParB family chromosome partitioning protein n=1 Tax=Armatimonas rosea TaxID=685828 RepID=A0A7W9SLF7_ARMRO|nr:ParB/RepB/Spo0J family partition protein [Armatimonas rosea]MBB6048324.1 ParB family chromosome partitioning protein [Armatimonas rosea]